MGKKNWLSGGLDWFFNWKPQMPENVLVVEDDDFMKPILTRALYLLNEDLKLTWVSSVPAARQCLHSGHYDLVIADFFLDGPSTGVDLQRYCSRRHPEVAVVVTSGLSREALQIREGVEIDSRDFIQKPLNAKKCLDKIHDVIERRWMADVRSTLF